MPNFQFSRRKELLVTVPQSEKPIDFFFLLFDDEFVHLILEATNEYAEEIFCAGNISERSRITNWKPLQRSEFLIFLGLLFHTGTVKCSRLEDYWKTDPLFNLKCFSEHMSRDRFLLILRCLHFARNPGEGAPKPDDRLYKIKPVIEFFNNKMRNTYYPGKELSLDESMMLWRGRLVFRQYIKNKRHKFGIKLYMLTEPSGTVLEVEVYTGAMDSKGGKGHASKVVMKLLQHKLNSGHSVYMDNYYNSCTLARELLDNQTFCTGTLRADRKGNPKDVVATKLPKGGTKAKYSNGIMIGKWKDKRDVLYISTEFPNTMVTFTNKRAQEKVKPLPILNYNKFMSGIDRQDQMMAYYPCSRKTLRWYKKLAIRGLLGASLSKPKVKKTSVVHAHHPTKIVATNEKGETKRKRCRQCSKNKITKKTIYECDQCSEKPGLCLGQCFQVYHGDQRV
ncbi:hypothetical protein NQ314_013679 [Rhamnusium bicolor]|uniref:PiggyBac transposable element-derived protein 4 n=1 Tax=Rhamnusium bicolor TaxID=1586634 RepID=A0AAV8X5G0_9CUCU|nr:hypothetical protein NQ314_013679 [Rhamnusium bicolor]